MESYKKRFNLAQNYTEELGLNLWEQPLPWKKKISVKKARDVLHLSRDVLASMGMRQSSDLATNCVAVHTTLQQPLRLYLGMKSYITIGDKYWHDYIYCEMSKNAIKEELSNPKLGTPLKAHVWLTLPDGSILDCTAEAHLDIIFGRKEHPLEKCLTFIPPTKNVKEGYHRPFLVGPDFLIKTGVFTKPHA